LRLENELIKAIMYQVDEVCLIMSICILQTQYIHRVYREPYLLYLL